MSILITGGAGYVGSHTMKILGESEDVLCLDNLSHGNRESVDSSKLIVGNIANKELLRAIFATNNIEAVIHFVASGEVGESVTNPKICYNNNLVNGLALLDVMVECGIKKIIFSSSSAIFGEPKTPTLLEDHPTNPISSYGETKLIFEHILRDYDRAYGLKHIALRYFNASGADPSGLIGEDHEPENHIIPVLLEVALGQRPHFEVFGTNWPTEDGTCIRDYTHVCDLAQAHILALESLRKNNISAQYNLGNGNGYSVMDLIICARKITGHSIPFIERPRRPGDPSALISGSKLITKELGYIPNFPAIETIIETAWRWHSTHPRGYK